MNSEDVPTDPQPAAEVELIVRVAHAANGSFLWPTPEVETRMTGRRQAAAQRSRGGGRGGR